MRAVDFTAYFTKKLAKPIQIDVEFREDHFFYAIEPMAVAEDTVHVPVSTKYEMWFGEGKKRGIYRRVRRPPCATAIPSRAPRSLWPTSKWQREHRDPRP